MYHKRQGEPLASCGRNVERPIIQPRAEDVDPSLQPAPRTQRKEALIAGINAIRCGHCMTKFCKNQKGLDIHTRSAHPGETALAVGVECESKDSVNVGKENKKKQAGCE